MRSRLCRVCGGFHDTEQAWPWKCRGHFPDPPHGTLNIISDTLDYVRNPADGKVYTSKGKYYRAVRAAGCEIVGNEKMARRPTPIDDPKNDIIEAMHKVRQGYKPPRRQTVHG